MKKLIFNILLIGLCLVILELGLRLSHKIPLKVVNESIFPNTLGDYKPYQSLLSDYVLPYKVTTNSLGLRGKDVRIEKTEGIYRILVLGDSYTVGERVSDEDTFPAQLEKMLSRVEVINAGHSCYSTREEYEYLAEKGLILNPDMVILAWFPNDITELSREFSWRDLLKEHYKYEPWKSYLRSFAIYNALRFIISDNFIKLKFGHFVPKEDIDIFSGQETEGAKKLWERCFGYILKIKNLCRGKKFLLVILPDYPQFKNAGFKPQQKLRTFAKINGIDFIDIAERFKLETNIGISYLLPKDPHFSVFGNHLVAEEIHNFLQKGMVMGIKNH